MADLLRLLQMLQSQGGMPPKSDFPAPLHPRIMEQRNLLQGDPYAEQIFQQAYGGQDNGPEAPQYEQSRHPAIEGVTGAVGDYLDQSNFRPRNFGEGLAAGFLKGGVGAFNEGAQAREGRNAEKKAAYKAEQKAAYEQKALAQKQYGDMAMDARKAALAQSKPEQSLEDKVAEKIALTKAGMLGAKQARDEYGIERWRPEAQIGEMLASTMDGLAEMYRNYGSLPPRGILTNPQGRAILDKAFSEPGANPVAGKADLQANMGSLVQQQKSLDAVRVFKKMTKANAEQLKFRMKKVLDTNSPLLNKPLRAIDASVLGNADMAAYRTAMQVVIPEYQRLLNNPNLTGVLTVDARHEMEKAINDNMTIPGLIKALEVLDIDGLARVKSLEEGVRDIKGRIRNPFSTDGGGPATGAPVVKWGKDAQGNPIPIGGQ